MDKETQQQLDEYHVERELTDIRETIIRLLVEGLDDHDPDCACHEWRRFQIIDLRREERKIRRLANLSEIDLDAFEEWRCDDALTLQEWREEDERDERFMRKLKRIILQSAWKDNEE